MTRPVLMGMFLLLAAGPATAGEDAAPAAEAAPVAAAPEESKSVESTKAADSGAKAFVPPPGFKTKKQGALTLYCKRDSTVGTRFKTERCYNEEQMKDYLLALEEQKRDIDRIRNTCANAAVCAPQ